MKISEIYEKFKNGEKVSISQKGQIKSIIKMDDGKYKITYEKRPKAKFFGRLTFC